MYSSNSLTVPNASPSKRSQDSSRSSRTSTRSGSHDPESKVSISAWIHGNINRRQCNRCVEKDGDDHDERAVKNGRQIPLAQKKWETAGEGDTIPLPTNAFGEIEFVGFGQKVAKYVRVDVKTSMDKMWELLAEQWKLKPPNLVISVTGGAGFFSLTPRLKEVFRKGLIKAAQSTDAWITSGGTNAGVMKYVGEAVRDYSLGQCSQKVIALGIAPWGVVQQKHVLINSPPSSGHWPVQYRISDEKIDFETYLDCNHSHFVLVDDGTQHEFAGEIDFRADLESSIAEKSSRHKADDGSAVKVPIVLVVVEGGPGTLQTVQSSLKKLTPAVIIAGSGRTANILAYAYQNAYEGEREEYDTHGKPSKRKELRLTDSTEEEVAKEITKHFGPKNLKKHMEMVTSCLQYPDLISIYQMDSKNSAKDIDIAILKALLKANKEQILEQLKLSLVWDRVDIAKSEILTEDVQFKPDGLSDVMFSAILWDRVDFVRLFLENGVNLRDFLTFFRLRDLYKKIPKKCPLRNYVRLEDDKKILLQVGYLIKSMMGDFYNPLYLQQDKKYMVPTKKKKSDSLRIFQRPERELFIWCILMDRCEMAKIFWEEGKDPLAVALVANSILLSLGGKAHDIERKDKLKNDARIFQELALGVLKSCYDEREDTTQKLLARNLKFWGQVNCVSVAVHANNKEFIAHSACQAWFNTVWWGDMMDNGIKIIPCILCPPLALFVLTYRDTEANIGTANADDTSQHETESNNRSPNKNRNSDTPSSDNSSLDEGSLTAGQKMKAFFMAPVTSFCYNVLFFLAFLVLFTYIMLFSFDTEVSNGEYLLIIWVGSLLIEELRQLYKISPGTVGSKVKNYFSEMWNLLDFLTVSLFIIGMILRAIPNAKTLVAARNILALNLFTFFMRLLHIFSVNKHMGPKLIMIGKMIVDLLSFMCIMVVFIVAYAVTSQAILYPNAELSSTVVIDVLKKAYWQIFAELFLEEIEGQNDNCVPEMSLYTNGTHARCPSDVGKLFVPFLLGLYMLFTNVLLLNLLIAMFSNTFQQVQDNTDQHWHFQRYKLIYEYYERPFLPPPFIIFAHIYRLLLYFKKGCVQSVTDAFVSDNTRKHADETRSLELFEENKRDDYLWKDNQKKRDTTDFKVTTTAKTLEDLMSRVDEMQENLSTVSQSEVKDGDTSIDKRMKGIEMQLSMTNKSLAWLIKSLSENNLGSKTSNPPNVEKALRNREDALKRHEDREKKEREEIKAYLESGNKLHTKSRSSPYPGSDVQRADVPDEKVPWKIAFRAYTPVKYTTRTVLVRPAWADGCDFLSEHPPEWPIYMWNDLDQRFNADRRSVLGQYEVKDGLPLNPCGRTGLTGRGRLGRWGPNLAVDPVVTRWKRDSVGYKVMDQDKPVLEFVAIKRRDNSSWALPGGFQKVGENTCRRQFTKEAMGNTVVSDTVDRCLRALFKDGEEVYTGYVDDPRNTDNAWVETWAVNFHDEKGELVKDLPLRAGETEVATAWMTLSSSLPIYASHECILQKVAELHGAAF